MKRSALFMICTGLSVLCVVLGCALAVVAWQRAGLPYNEQGHYFNGLVNYHQQSVLGYALAALAALLLAGALAWG
ncbi:hypothetical protein NK983_29685, partial [Salmonella enterica subsp. enterica serovar Typhimurium]|nr:hypothetical protein [Salmonella enterica subsp. enterica serovar Typhimurium]